MSEQSQLIEYLDKRLTAHEEASIHENDKTRAKIDQLTVKVVALQTTCPIHREDTERLKIEIQSLDKRISKAENVTGGVRTVFTQVVTVISAVVAGWLGGLFSR